MLSDFAGDSHAPIAGGAFFNDATGYFIGNWKLGRKSETVKSFFALRALSHLWDCSVEMASRILLLTRPRTLLNPGNMHRSKKNFPRLAQANRSAWMSKSSHRAELKVSRNDTVVRHRRTKESSPRGSSSAHRRTSGFDNIVLLNFVYLCDRQN
jgi:hypothetical protein